MSDDRYKGLGKTATICTVVLLVSAGLCGVTIAHASKTNGALDAMMPFGLLEFLGMAIGAVGLFVTGVTAFVKWVASFGEKDPQ